MRRRLSFAAPFVVIVASCGGKAAPPTTTHNPPQPVTESKALPDPPEGEGKRTEGPNGPMFEYANGDIVYVGADGTCHAQYKEHCATEDEGGKPVVSNCNPPPPQQVKCPK